MTRKFRFPYFEFLRSSEFEPSVLSSGEIWDPVPYKCGPLKKKSLSSLKRDPNR